MKFIKYMNIVPVDTGFYFLINRLNGAVDTIDEKGYQICQRWMSQDKIIPTKNEKTAYEYLRSLSRHFNLKRR